MQSGRTAKFLVLFTAALFFVCVVIFLLLRHIVLHEYLVYNMHFISTSVRHEAAESLTPGDFTHVDDATHARFDAYFESLPEYDELLHVKVWSLDGTIIHSDQQELIGKSFPSHGAFLASLGEQSTTALYPTVEAYEETDAPAIETYIPLSMSVDGRQRVVGVIEVYQTVDVITAMHRKLMVYLIIVLGVATLILLPLLGYLHWRFVRSAEEQALRLAVANKDLAMQTEELSAAYVKLQSFDRSKDKFVSHVNHELRTPLAVIKGYAELMPDKGPLNAEQKESLDVIQESVSTMQTTIDNLLDIAKMEEGKQRFEMRAVPVHDIIVPVAAEFKPLIVAKGLVLTSDIPALPPMLCDAHQMRGVVRNLLSNAVKYTPTGGKIDIHTAADSRFIVLSVSDTGIGIPEEHIASLFDRFSRTSKDGLGGEASSGLGLSIVKQVIEQHGGTIAVKSVLGKGTTFSVRIPAETTASGQRS